MKKLWTAFCLMLAAACCFAEGNTTRSATAFAPTRVELVVGSVVLTGVLYDTAVARAFAALLPQTVRLSRYADREYYGGISGTISAAGERKRTFTKGELSYCPANNSFAVWFDKEEQTLGMDIIKIGELTSDYGVLRELPSGIQMTVRLAP
ncbi:MAG: hypothetical protein K2J50_03915 [Treponemataceae bacterium]|nr:hypothetical protein [Treponemataceae bacterium]